MKKVLLSNIHKYFIVDDEDEIKCLSYSWCLGGNNDGIYAQISNKTISIGRFILNYSDELEIDHKDRNIFNNKRNNLRIATKSQNNANKFNKNNTSGYKGVSWDKAKK